jgi:4-alpha-glucanotransferase
MDATEGAYVRYPRDELFAVLALESHRHDCIVVGEDLGTVPDEVRTAMADHRVLRTYVAEFAIPAGHDEAPAAPDDGAIASVDTHDTPTFAGFLHGLDIAHRVETELLDVHDAHHEFEARERQVDNLRAVLRARGLLDPVADDHALLVGLLRFLGSSDADCVIVALEDLWGEIHPQNIPGTSVDRPNWVQRFPFELDELRDLPRAKAALDALALARKEPTRAAR